MPTLLLLAASPLDQDRLRLGNEVKQIKQALKRSHNRENWIIESNEAATVDDLRRALLDFHPTIIHFAGHGGGSVGLAFETDDGITHETHAEPLTKLFHHFKDTLKCVVLNACFSQVQADEIRNQIDYVIGMSSGINDTSANKFAVAFYDSIFAESTFRQAFDIACASIDLSNLPNSDVPVLLTGPSINNITLPYTSLIPQFEDLILRYLNSSFDERYKFTTKGESIREIMSKFYSQQFHTIFDKVTVFSTRQIDEEHWQIHCALEVKGKNITGDYYLRIKDRTIQVEWEATVGYWSTPPKTYLALGSSEPIIARVFASLGTLYLGNFYDKANRYQAIDLSTKNHKSLYGYILRHSQEGKKLIDLLSDGSKHAVTLSIGNIDDDTDHPLIDSLLSDSWLLDQSSIEQEY